MAVFQSREKGNRLEREVGKIFREWSKDFIAARGEKPEDWFKRTPNSGAWSRRHAPGEDLMIPPWFTPAIECKHREEWTWSAFLQGLDGNHQLWGMWDETAGKVTGRPVFMVFTQNREPRWLLMELRTLHQILRKGNEVDEEEPDYHVIVRGKDGERRSFALIELERFLGKVEPAQLTLAPEPLQIPLNMVVVNEKRAAG